MRLRFVKCAHDLVSAAISGAELGFWCAHVEADVGGFYLGAHADGGVQARPIGYDRAYAPLELFVDVPATPAQEAAFEAFLRAQIGKPYDMALIFDLAAGLITMRERDWRRPESWICSELQAAALEAAGIFPFGLPDTADHVTPQSLLFAVSAIAKTGAPQPAFPVAA